MTLMFTIQLFWTDKTAACYGITVYHLSSASSPGALLLKRCRYMKRLHEVAACNVVSALREMGCVRDRERLADLVAVMTNIENSEK